MTALALLALLVALVALAVGVVLVVRVRPVLGDRRRTASAGLPADLPEDLAGLRREVAALRAEAASALRHLGVVRYDAFADQGGHFSWSVALLDDRGDGVLLTSIHGRNDARAYAKGIAGWQCDQALSPEEAEAVAAARP